MAFDEAQLSLLAYANGFGIWQYQSPTDSLATIGAAGYLKSRPHIMRAGHMLLIDASDGRAWRAVAANTGGDVELGALAGDGGSLSPGSVGTAELADGAVTGPKLDRAYVEPASLAPVATSGDYGDLANRPALGTAAAADTGDFATAAQGAKADSALQPDLAGGTITNYLAAQDSLTGDHTFVQADSGREKVFTGATPATWTIPALSAGSHAVVHNIGTADISFVASGVTLKGLATLAADKTASVSWLPGNVVKLTGELS